jgi:hypothetical protein
MLKVTLNRVTFCAEDSGLAWWLQLALNRMDAIDVLRAWTNPIAYPPAIRIRGT